MPKTNDKLAAAAHYLIARIHPSQLGATKLQKALWFADCAMYARHGRTITGEERYVRKPMGPCSPRLESVLAALKSDGRIEEEHYVTMIGYPRREFRSIVEPELCCFEAEEVDLLMQVGTEIAKLTAQEASELSHDALWIETKPNAAMYVAAGAVRVEPLSDSDLDWARAAFA